MAAPERNHGLQAATSSPPADIPGPEILVWLPTPWASATIRGDRGTLDFVEGDCVP